ncbi:MAG: glutamyl-tRNA reductase [Rhodospirillales bacterium]
MPTQPPDLARLLIVGANHRSGSVGLRDRLFMEESELPAVSRDLVGNGISEVLLLSTCDRVECFAVCDSIPAAREKLRAYFASRAGDDTDMALYDYEGEQALSHLFRVAASLDSQIVGEPQVLGQVKTAHRCLRDANAPFDVLGSVLEKAYEVAKKVRTGTSIGEGPVTIVAAAVRVARDLHGDLRDTRLLVLGGGDAGELIGDGLIRAGVRHARVAVARRPLAVSLAQRLGAHVGDFDDLGNLLEEADTVVLAHGGATPLVDRELMRQVLRRRRQKPVFLIDTSIPSDCDPGIELLDSAFLYDLADLERLASDGLNGRVSAAAKAEAMVRDEVRSFMASVASNQAGGAIRLLHEQIEVMRQEALARSGGDAEKATRLLAGRFLTLPTEALRQAGRDGQDSSELESFIAALFRTDKEN